MTERDGRGYWSLPQLREEQSYYVYGTPPNGAGQFAHPRMLSFLFLLDFRWSEISDAKIGIGNISRANGVPDRHSSHVNGLSVDIRPFRTDRRQVSVRWTDADYDRNETRKLVGLMWQTMMVKTILFNDPRIARVRPYIDHDNHLHVEVQA
jgi:murein endopeptidase